MKAIILNAGKGGRLAPLTDSRPKCLIEVGAKTLLDHQLTALRSVGVREIVLVLGYRREQIIEHLAGYADLAFTFIENPDFAVTNTAYSLWLARHEMTDDFVYLNGDVLFHPEVMRRLAGATAANALAVERKACGDEEVKAVIDGNRITAIGKHLSPEISFGEFIGLARFSKTMAPLFRRTLEQVIEHERLLKDYFEVALERMCASTLLTAVDISDLPCVEIDFPEDLERARDQVLPLLEGEGAARRRRVLLYAERNLHLQFLEPVHDCLSGRGDVELAFSAPPFVPALDGRTGWGLPPDEVSRLDRKGRFVQRVEDFSPDVTIVADFCTTLGECGKLVNVGHGIISKGYYYTTRPVVRRENLADLTCVPGPWHKEILEENLFSPVVVTGFVKSDRLFGPNAVTRDDVRRGYGIPDGKQVVLFAPTFNPELSAIPCIRERIAELCDGGTVLLVKLHGMTDRAWVEMYRGLADRHRDVLFVDDLEISSAMAAADVMVSDVSSAFVEFFFLNRPVVLFVNPRHREYHNYVADDIEYRVRDACLTVGTVEELKLAVRLSFANPAEFEAQRRRYTEALCYGRDGKAARRVADAVMQLLDGAFCRSFPKRVNIALLWDSAPAVSELAGSIAEIRRKSGGVPNDIICIGPRPANLNTAGLGIRSWIDRPSPDGSGLNQVCMLGGEYTVFLKGGRTLPDGWLHWLCNYFRWFPGTGAVQALSTAYDYRSVAARLFAGKEIPPLSELSRVFLRTFMGSDLPAAALGDECVMLDGTLSSGAGPFQAHLPAAEALGDLGRRLTAAGAAIRHAPDVFVYPAESPSATPAFDGSRETEAVRPAPCARGPASCPSREEIIAQARNHLERKDYRKALELFEQANPGDDATAMADMAECCAQVGRLPDAERFYRQSLDAAPNFARAHVGLGVVRLLTGQTAEAEAAFAHALRLEPAEARALCGLGMARCAQGLDREAFGLFARALDQDPENLSALHESARLAYLIGSFEEAAGRMRTYLMYHPGDIDILFSLAGLLYKAKCCDEARDAIERVMALSPDYEGAGELLRLISEETALGEGSPSAPQTTSARADKEAARLLKEAGRFDEALSIYVKLLDERDRSVLADMGDCLANLGRVDDAAESYREALREDIGDAKAMIGLGVANILRNRPEEAESFLTRALTIDPGNSKALSGLGMAQNLQGKRPEAFDCFRRALDADPEQLAALNGLVGCSFELQRFAEAERHLTKYLMYHPADLDMLFSLAGVQYKMGKPSDALDNIEKVLLFEPCYQGGRELMDRIREQTAA